MFVFEQCLAAGTAGTNGSQLEAGIVGGALGEGGGVARGNGKGIHRHSGIFRGGIPGGGALGTDARGIGGILLVRAPNNHAIGKLDGSADVEFRVGDVAAIGGTLGGADNFAVALRELFKAIDTYRCRNFYLFHSWLFL